MSIDHLYSLVTAAILRAEQMEERQMGSAANAWAEVSSLEEQLAASLPASLPEGRIARRGAVRAALKSGNRARAQTLAQGYLADEEAPEDLRSAIIEMLGEGFGTFTDRKGRTFKRLSTAARPIVQLYRQVPISNGPSSELQAVASFDQVVDFDQVVEGYFDQVYYFFRRQGFQNDVSHDLTQKTFFRVFKSRDTFRGESRLDAWIFQVARNVGLNEVRSRGTQKREGAEVSLADEDGLPLPMPDAMAPAPLDLVLEEERARKLRDALEEMPPQMRRCVELRLNQDLKYREIADLIGISIETVKAHLFQARQQLREKLSDYFTDIEL